MLEKNQSFRDQVKWLKEHSPIYPKVLLKHTDTEEIIATTLIRKEHEGKWYLWHLVQRAVVPIGENAEGLMERVMLHAYNILILGKVNLKCRHLSGEPMFELDPSQTPEVERLANIINPKK